MVIARSHPQYNNGRYCLVVEVLNVCEKADVHPRMSFHLNVINCRCSPAIQLVCHFFSLQLVTLNTGVVILQYGTIK